MVPQTDRSCIQRRPNETSETILHRRSLQDSRESEGKRFCDPTDDESTMVALKVVDQMSSEIQDNEVNRYTHVVPIRRVSPELHTWSHVVR